ncbi:hypothetical protein [Enterococcus sp. DIV0187]|uniref:hypothetical protein n=1 Tax=Enterococcus sp. DIV0187 TaxID=2774644 RepID=UPI003F20DAC3
MKKFASLLLCSCLLMSLTACDLVKKNSVDNTQTNTTTGKTTESSEKITLTDEQKEIQGQLNLANNADQEWSFSDNAWVLSIVTAVTNPEIADQQGVSVCVPAAYVKGIDTDEDGKVDVTSDKTTAAVKGQLVIDYNAEITSTNGQIYTAATAPVILNTGAAGYSSSTNTLAGTTYAAEGYINVTCGNRGKQDIVTDEEGNETYTGDAPSCLVDQKNAARYVKYNILAGNLPGNVDYFVSTGGSGGGAHATMFAATSNNEDFYDYEIAAGTVGVYQNEDGSYTTAVSVNDKTYVLSDGAWGCIAYSAITPLAEADISMAFEYYLDTTYEFSSDFQKQTAKYLADEYMNYINEQDLSADESVLGFDINEDGDTDDTIDLKIEYDLKNHPDTNGYYGTYLNLYLDKFRSNLQWYLDNLDYAEGWTWFDIDGNALSNEEVAALTEEEKTTAFLEGHYAKGSIGGMEGAPGGVPSGAMPSGTPPTGEVPTDAPTGSGDSMVVGTPDSGTTQAAGSLTDSANYASYEEMLEAYTADVEAVTAGDEYGNNIVELYNPLNYIDDETTENLTWVRIVMGAAEGDMSLFSSMNLELAMAEAGIDSKVEWQWDGGHVPSETLSETFSLYVDQMYGKYVNDNDIETPASTDQTENGTATEATGTDITSWVNTDDTGKISFDLKAAVSYRTKGASKSIPGFDVIDYGQEDYVFGDATTDARHWDKYVLKVFEENQEELSKLFNK